MSELKEIEVIKEAIENYNVFSAGQKRILKILVEFDDPVPVDVIQKVGGATRQAFNFSIQGLLALGFISREKQRVFIYQINQEKIKEIVNIYEKQKKLTNNT
jgi:predicted transcriptional regulator